MTRSLRTLAIKGLLWSASESVGSAVLALGAFVALARLLDPADFGLVALAGSFVLSFNLFVGHSFSDALVQSRRLDPEHPDTAFWGTVGLAVLFMAVCHLAAEPAAAWFEEPELASILPWLSFALLLNAFSAVPLSLCRRELRFRTVALRCLVGRAIGATGAIAMAFAGWGAWSLVGQQLVTAGATCIALATVTDWRPGFRFSLQHLREMGSFGIAVSASQLVSGLMEQSVNLIVGSTFGTVVLGYFAIAWRTVQLIRSLISSAVYQVGFTTFSKLQDDVPAMSRAFLTATRVSSLVGFPIGVGLALVASPTITLVFGERWAESAVLLTILALEMVPAFYGMFLSAAYRALGRPGWVLALSLLYAGVALAGMLAATPWGVQAVAVAWVAKSFLLMPVHWALIGRLLSLSMRTLAGIGVAPMAGATAMAAVVLPLLWTLEAAGYGSLVPLTLAIPVGAAIYAGSLWLLAPDLVHTVIEGLRVMTSRRGSTADPLEAAS